MLTVHYQFVRPLITVVELRGRSHIMSSTKRALTTLDSTMYGLQCLNTVLGSDAFSFHEFEISFDALSRDISAESRE